jgi:hypothetical protein
MEIQTACNHENRNRLAHTFELKLHFAVVGGPRISQMHMEMELLGNRTLLYLRDGM